MIASITWFKLHLVFSQAYNSDCSVTGPINQFISDHFTRPVSFGSWSKMCEHRSVLYCTLTENKIMFYGVTVRSSKGISYFKQDSRCYPVQFSDQLYCNISLSGLCNITPSSLIDFYLISQRIKWLRFRFRKLQSATKLLRHCTQLE